MSLTKLFSLFALVSLSSFSVAACAASTDSSTDEGQAANSADEELKASITACKIDDDCTAVSQGGCCDNGYLFAVNKTKVTQYENATKCTANPRPMCPMFMVHDTRVAQCNTTTNKCEMIQPTDIKCGGFVAHPHACPSGYDCEAGGMPDMPGSCVEAKDCRSSGCGAGMGCQMCWGKYACVPEHAMC
jgi:hypothetical protein